MRISLVTGCNGGMGKAICAALRDAGDRVIGLDHPGTEKAGTDLDRFVPCDLSDLEAVESALSEIQSDGPIGCLVNCAGLYEKRDVFDLTLDDFDRVLSVNLRSPFLLTQTLARGMRDAGGGTVINIASINGKLGSPMIPYGTSKAGLIGMTKSFAKTLAPYNIRVNAIAPGTIRTPMAEGVNAAQMERQMYNVPMARWGEPEEIAGVVVFLASDASTYMTGAVLDVAGGWMS